MSRVYEPRIWGAFSPAGQADCQGVCTHFPKLTSPYKITFTVEERTEKAKPSALISLTPPFMFSFSSHLHSLSNLLITFESHSVKPLCVLTDTGGRNLVNFFCFVFFMLTCTYIFPDDAAVFVAFTLRSLSAVVCC